MSTLGVVLLTAWVSIAVCYVVLGAWLDGPIRGLDVLLLVLSALLWPVMPLVVLWRTHVTITRNTAKTAPVPTGADTPEPVSGSEEPDRDRGGSAA